VHPTNLLLSLVGTVQLTDGTFSKFEENMMKKQMLVMPTYTTIYKDGR